MMNSKFMRYAIDEAKKASDAGEIPVGAVIVKDNKIISVGRNRREEKQNSLSHAEIEAINDACKALGTWRLDGCTMYVTLEPCLMCMGAIVSSRIDTLVFGAFDLQNGCAESKISPKVTLSLPKPEIFGGIYEDECSLLIKDFFDTVRKNDKPKSADS